MLSFFYSIGRAERSAHSKYMADEIGRTTFRPYPAKHWTPAHPWGTLFLGMMVLVLPLIVFSSAGFLGFAFYYRSVPIAFLNVFVLLLAGSFLQPWLIFSPPASTAESLFAWKLVVFAWFAFFVIGVFAALLILVIKKKRHRHRRVTF